MDTVTVCAPVLACVVSAVVWFAFESVVDTVFEDELPQPAMSAAPSAVTVINFAIFPNFFHVLYLRVCYVLSFFAICLF